ncbi:hypothetical protein [Paenibacillus ihbetae]|uniref:Uncharacterized protein n=1 Tax=Paenibacillus ihbetae TaxID=1870820 RepID=A0ABX3JSD9_9BACL|nr:hypothetical protein [Paenibacillus ihbetae]OOC60607.1 hypothetical protein BBD40_01160 [Paenibacillus ihbetae]
MRYRKSAAVLFLLAFLLSGIGTSYAMDSRPIDNETEQRLRDAYNLEAPTEELLPSVRSEGDFGFTPDAPLFLPKLIKYAFHPILIFIQECLFGRPW